MSKRGTRSREMSSPDCVAYREAMERIAELEATFGLEPGEEPDPYHSMADFRERCERPLRKRIAKLESAIREAPCGYSISGEYPRNPPLKMCDDCDCWKREVLK